MALWQKPRLRGGLSEGIMHGTTVAQRAVCPAQTLCHSKAGALPYSDTDLCPGKVPGATRWLSD